MYLHLGQNTVVKEEEVLGIFDLEATTVSKITRNYIRSMKKDYNIFSVSDEMPKSFVTCVDRKGLVTVYISQLSSSTLRKRMENAQDPAE